MTPLVRREWTYREDRESGPVEIIKNTTGTLSRYFLISTTYTASIGQEQTLEMAVGRHPLRRLLMYRLRSVGWTRTRRPSRITGSSPDATIRETVLGWSR